MSGGHRLSYLENQAIQKTANKPISKQWKRAPSSMASILVTNSMRCIMIYEDVNEGHHCKDIPALICKILDIQ